MTAVMPPYAAHAGGRFLTSKVCTFHCGSIPMYRGGGVQNQAEKFEKCLLAGTGRKIYFSRICPFTDSIYNIM